MMYEFVRTGKIYVTGITGLLGTSFVSRLLSHPNFEGTIYGLTRNVLTAKKRFSCFSNDPRLILLEGDVSRSLPFIKADYYIHAASNTHPRLYVSEPVQTITTNVNGLINVLEMARRVPQSKVLFCSSCEVYGDIEGDYIREDQIGSLDLADPRSGYNEAKRLCENLCAAYKAEYGVNYTIARFSRMYGPGVLPNDSKAINQFLFKAARQEDIVLKSKGDQIFDYLYVDDAVDAVLLLLKKGQPQAYNVANNTNMSLKEICDYLACISGVKVIQELPDFLEEKGYSRAAHSVLDISLVKKLGFKPKVSLEEGLKRTLDSLKKFL